MDTGTTRPHRSNNNNTTTTNSSNNSTSELFICFTSRLSSSSMKISSKSILSPGRTREPSQISLSSSLSRRLRSNGSMKGGQASPMFPTNGKKRGCAFENPEPSSPKVTCIGQVRVKTKKQGKKIRARSKRRGEVSFRKVDQQNTTTNNNNNVEASNYQFQQQECLPHRNQRWVHLPMTICEAIREFNCFLPCKSSCMASEREKEEKAAGSSENGSSCGAVFARWLVAVQDGEEKEAREIELVVGEEDREENVMRISQRRHVFEGIDIGDFEEGKCEETSEIVEQEEGRVSICIPPKNALLLMRCRSDPVKMAALANRFWECPVPEDEGFQEDDDQEKEGVKEGGNDNEGELEPQKEEEEEIGENSEEQESPQVEEALEQENEQESPRNETDFNEAVQESRDFDKQEDEVEVQETNEVEEEVVVSSGCSHEDVGVVDQENEDYYHYHQEQSEPLHENQDEEAIDDSIASLFSSEQESEEEEQEETEAATAEEESTTEEEQETRDTQERSEPENPETTHEPKLGPMSKERDTSVLPDCLLLMMCEPKLSMEVSKETWVCSTDFIRWLPERPPPQPQPQQQPVVNKKDGPDEPKKRLSTDSNNNNNNSAQLQPPRSSCSFPVAPPMAAASMATMIEQKLVGSSNAYEPFVLTRCKSEPMRSAAKLAPEACFWKNRKLEPHRPATLGVGAAGVGF